jgi:hypothetical protein
MKQNFISNGLTISVNRDRNTNDLNLHISSEYSRTQHKGKLYVNSKVLAREVEDLWKSIKTKKLQSMSVAFGEIDWYDDMTDIYETPKVSIKRGLRKGVISHHEHGSVPKDWDFNLSATFSDTSTSTPIMEVVKNTLGSFFTPELEKKFKKSLTPVLQKKSDNCSVENEWKEVETYRRPSFINTWR